MTIRKLYENSRIEQNRQMSEISSEFNQQINTILPDCVKESCKRITACYVTDGKNAKELAALLDAVIPSGIRERINQLRKERHMNIKAAMHRDSRRIYAISSAGPVFE